MNNANILILDDDKPFAEALNRLLSAEGYNVKVYHHPMEAIDKIKISPPDIIIVDCMLPKQNGIDFVLNIRAEVLTLNQLY